MHFLAQSFVYYIMFYIYAVFINIIFCLNFLHFSELKQNSKLWVMLFCTIDYFNSICFTRVIIICLSCYRNKMPNKKPEIRIKPFL